jgi:hypothetical protein
MQVRWNRKVTVRHMLRIPTGVSLCFTLLTMGAALVGCSSDSVDGGGGNAGSGNPSTAGTGTGGSGAGGTGASNGGSGSNVAGTNPGRAGSASGGGSAGTPGGSCTPGAKQCTDDATLAICNEDTGETEMFSCDSLAEFGIDSAGCIQDAAGDGCDVTFAEEACGKGATVFAICGQFTQEQYINAYVNCFQDNGGLQMLIRCAGPFLDASGMDADCDGVEAECAQYLPPDPAGGSGGGGSGGSAGTGGAP